MPRYLIDRSLGGLDLQAALRERGEIAERVVDHFPHDDESGVDDTEWLGFAGDEGYAVLTKDGRIRRLAHERQVVCEQRILVFCIGNAQLQGPEMIRRFLDQWERIVEICLNGDGPSFYQVGRRVEPLILDCDFGDDN